MTTRSCQTPNLLVRRIDDRSTVPTRGSSDAAGYDLYSSTDFTIHPGQRLLVSTGIAIEVPCGTYGRIAPRSGLAVRHGINVGAGVVDRDYRGEVKILLFNHGEEVFEGKVGDRVAQLVLEQCKTPDVQEVSERALTDTERGASGFGSSGK